MKKILVIVSALILAAACAAPPTNQPTSTANTNSAETPSAVAMTEADAIAKEKAIWDAIKTKDYEAFANMLADDQLEVMGESVNDKAASIAGVKDFEPTETTFSDWKFLSIDKDAFVVTYTVEMKGKYKGKEFPAETDRASSAWVNRGGKWLAAYHQECKVAPPMPPAKESAAKATTKATPTPAAAPAATAAGPDPIANEKMVWDLFKSKNYDGFAALLAPDFLEVEPDKVYTKAESVKTVAEFDASKATLSDWKVVKLDDDASIVTYVAKFSPGPPNGERHSTIWANRDGKWLGVFHHGGTPVMKPGAMATASPSPSTSPKSSPSPAAKASPVAKASPAMKATPKRTP
jgi:hypothetical protein